MVSRSVEDDLSLKLNSFGNLNYDGNSILSIEISGMSNLESLGAK